MRKGEGVGQNCDYVILCCQYSANTLPEIAILIYCIVFPRSEAALK